MRFTRVAPSLVALTLAACADATEPLNSERIEEEFGSYGLDVISFRDGLRRASLYSTHDSGKVTRTYAISHFDDIPQHVRDNEHARILAGSSIGATFKSAGWSIHKETLYIGAVNPRADVHGIRQLMQLSGAPDLAMHVYRLHVNKDAQIVDYATIIEIYHPEYMTQARLHEIFGKHAAPAADETRIEHWRSLVLTDSHVAHDTD